MTDRFESFTTDIAHIYKNVQRIKKREMSKLGLKGTHVICINYLNMNPDGLTASEICTLSKEDKAGISRTLSELEEMEFITYDENADKRKYRAKAILTEKGKEYAIKVNELIVNAVNIGGSGITEKERIIFYRVLSTISQNLQKFCEESEKEEDTKNE